MCRVTRVEPGRSKDGKTKRRHTTSHLQERARATLNSKATCGHMARLAPSRPYVGALLAGACQPWAL